LLLVACASSSEGPDAIATTPQPRSGATIFDRLHDATGQLAGLAGFSIVQVADATRCGGIATTLVRASDASVAPADQPLVAFLETGFAAGLDFNEPTRAQSIQRFDAWLDDMKQRAHAALDVYTEQVASSPGDSASIVELARTVQIQRHFASTLLRSEIPVDVRTGDHVEDKIAAYCGALTNAAVPLLDKADAAATTCAEVATRLAPGWWSSVCVH
jgi:hypothetical protein